jgi:hypothetical protein
MISSCNETKLLERLSAAKLEVSIPITTPSPTIMPIPTFPPYPENDLESINNKVVGFWDDLQQKYSISVMGSGLGKDYISMEIRKFGDFEQSISKEEIKAIRKTLFDDIGKEFPLKLDVIEFTKDGYLSGKIEKIEHDRILIVNKLIKNGNTQDPQASFVGLTKDGKIYIHGKPEAQSFDTFKVGQEVRAWTTGLTLDSYPSQVGALKIEIME